jgi:DNA-binding NarL/FixJ family response regulator
MQRILLIDDHQLFSDGLELILSKLGADVVVEQTASARVALSDVEKLGEYDLILVDLEMPNIDGFGFLKAIKERGITTPVAIVSASQNRTDIETSLKLGAVGFIPKYASSPEMLAGVAQVLKGQNFVPEHIVGPIDWPTSTDKPNPKNVRSLKISQRQYEILQMMYAGNSNNDIAIVLNISESAVKTHVSRLFRALEVKNRTACVRAAIEKDLIQLHSPEI